MPKRVFSTFEAIDIKVRDFSYILWYDVFGGILPDLTDNSN